MQETKILLCCLRYHWHIPQIFCGWFRITHRTLTDLFYVSFDTFVLRYIKNEADNCKLDTYIKLSLSFNIYCILVYNQDTHIFKYLYLPNWTPIVFKYCPATHPSTLWQTEADKNAMCGKNNIFCATLHSFITRKNQISPGTADHISTWHGQN